MINITIVKQKQNIITIEVSGHSGYADAGQDILCASVSTLTQNLINGLTEVLNIKPDYIIDEDVPLLKVALPNLDDVKMKDCQILMQSTYLGLKDLSDSYPKFIKIKEKQ